MKRGRNAGTQKSDPNCYFVLITSEYNSITVKTYENIKEARCALECKALASGAQKTGQNSVFFSSREWLHCDPTISNCPVDWCVCNHQFQSCGCLISLW